MTCSRAPDPLPLGYRCFLWKVSTIARSYSYISFPPAPPPSLPVLRSCDASIPCSTGSAAGIDFPNGLATNSAGGRECVRNTGPPASAAILASIHIEPKE